jgi:hypothetical protein
VVISSRNTGCRTSSMNALVAIVTNCRIYVVKPFILWIARINANRYSSLRRILPHLLSAGNCAFERTPGRLRAQGLGVPRRMEDGKGARTMPGPRQVPKAYRARLGWSKAPARRRRFWR